MCPVCGNEPAIKDPVLGVLPCPNCQARRNGNPLVQTPMEFTSQEIRDGRVKYADHLLQPYRGGEVSKEYIQKYGTKGLKVTEQEIKKAKNTWRDLSYYGNNS